VSAGSRISKPLLEVLVFHLWACAAIAFLLRLLATTAGSGLPRPMPPDRPRECTFAGTDPAVCSNPFTAASVPADGVQGFYIVQSAATRPCAVLRGHTLAAARTQSAAVDVLEKECRLVFRGELQEGHSLCEDLAEQPCNAFLVPRDQVRSCASLVAGPFDASGAFNGELAMPPLLTILPLVAPTSFLLDVQRLRGMLYADFSPAAGLLGAAFKGTLVVPLAAADPDHLARPAFGNLLHSIGQMVSFPPRPKAVVVDLAALSPCPSRRDVQAIASYVLSQGMTPIGYVGEDGRDVLYSDISEGGNLVGRIAAVRVDAGDRSSCPTLITLAPADVASYLERALPSREVSPAPVAVTLHWTPSTSSLEARNATVEALLDWGAFVVAGSRPAEVPAGMTVHGSGLAVTSAGSFLDEGSVLPGASPASGVMLQCTALAPGAAACRMIPLAQTLGEATHAYQAACSSCELLPGQFFASLYGKALCK
jgi:hypothetical protein